ncbi:MAG: MaoC/PaaZ C-terminal domain-containing protein [Promethearchaeota archaeon]
MSKLDLSLVGKKEKKGEFKYDWKDVVLYAVGIGAQANELQFIYENAPGGLQVFPSFATIIAQEALIFPGNIDFSRYLHGEMLIRLYHPFPKKGAIMRESEITNIYDKGKGAVIITKTSGYLKNGTHVYDADYTHFYVGAGGFGGDPGPKNEPLTPPEGIEPDFSITYKTAENQAVIYRLSGDTNPLHVDPKFAKMGGQTKPILHGLCTYGFATRAILYGACEGNVSRFKEFNARFTNVVYPGDNLTTEGWKFNDKYIIQVRTEKSVVLGNAYAIIE